MSKRPNLRANAPSEAALEAERATAHVRELERRRATAPGQEDRERPMTNSTIHLPVDLLNDLRAAAMRRAGRKATEHPAGRGGRPSVSEIVVELLEKHREELRALD